MKPPVIRIAAASGAYLRKRLHALCLMVMRGAKIRREIMDGYLLSARAERGGAVGVLVDMPQRIGWASGIDAAEYGLSALAGVYLRAYMAVPGRDALLLPSFGPALASAAVDAPLPPAFINPVDVWTAGANATYPLDYGRANAERASNGYLVECKNRLVTGSPDRLIYGSWEYLRDADGADCVFGLHPLPIANQRIVDGALETSAITALSAGLSMIVTDAYVQSRTGGGRLVARISPPRDVGSPPTVPQQDLYDAATPWCTGIPIIRANGVAQWWVAAQAVNQIDITQDVWGERFVWIGLFRVSNWPEDPDGYGASLVTDYGRRNVLDGSPMRQPEPATASKYLRNDHVPWVMFRVSPSIAVAYGSFVVQRIVSSVQTTFLTAEVHGINLDTAAPLSVTRLLDAHDLSATNTYGANNSYAFCIGGDAANDWVRDPLAPLEGAFISVGSSPTSQLFRATRIGGTGAVLGSTEFDVEFFQYGGGAGQARYCVEHIGNHKYVFPASTQLAVSSPYETDFVMAVYDSLNDTLTIAGEVEALITMTDNGARYAGRPCCVQKEVTDAEGNIIQPAVVLATRGAYGILEGQGGNELGATFISYDSCATWHKIANVGSPRAVAYGGSPAYVPDAKNLKGV